MLATIERLACVLEARDIPTETQKDLMDGIIRDLKSKAYNSGPDEARATRRINAREKRLTEESASALLAHVEKWIKRLQAQIPALKEAQGTAETKRDVADRRAYQTLNREFIAAKVNAEGAEKLLGHLEEEQSSLERILGKIKKAKPGPTSPPKKKTRK
jgi:predicted  nucleic acid-binding Zn-ribbon protein